MDYECDDRKVARNLKLHRVAFEVALLVFDDPARMDILDDREDYGEERWVTIGHASGKLLHGTHTAGDDGTMTRIISARVVTKREADEYHENLGG